MLRLSFPANLGLGYCMTHVWAKEAHMETNDTFTHLQISVFVGPKTLPPYPKPNYCPTSNLNHTLTLNLNKCLNDQTVLQICEDQPKWSHFACKMSILCKPHFIIVAL